MFTCIYVQYIPIAQKQEAGGREVPGLGQLASCTCLFELALAFVDRYVHSRDLYICTAVLLDSTWYMEVHAINTAKDILLFSLRVV